MRWWTHLYMVDRAAKRGAAVLRNIREQKILPDTYVITPSSYGHHLFDIRPVMLLRPEERTSEDFLVLGVACGYGEAGEVERLYGTRGGGRAGYGRADGRVEWFIYC